MVARAPGTLLADPVIMERTEETAGFGLTSERARALLEEHGPNDLQRRAAQSPWAIMAAQLGSPLIWLLLAASIVSAVLGEVADAIAIGAIVVINALVGFFQEYRAERAILALRAISVAAGLVPVTLIEAGKLARRLWRPRTMIVAPGTP